MNGIEKKQQQVRSGVRPIVECIDGLRIKYGFDVIRVLTPIVETKLRNGQIAARTMQLSFQPVPTVVIHVIISPKVFPSISLNGGLSDNLSSIQSWLDETCGHSNDGEHDLMQILAELSSKLEGLSDSMDDALNGNEQALLVNVEDDVLEDNDDDLVNTANDNAIKQESVVDQLNDGSVKMTQQNETLHQYCCRICRYQLFTTSDLEEHSRSKQSNSSSSLSSAHMTACTSLSLAEPPSYLDTNTSQQQEENNTGEQGGKIYCPKCKNRVGSWSWVGSKCSCMEWVVPAFQFTVSKIDMKIMSRVMQS